MLHSCMITLVLSNDRMSKMKKSSFSGLDLLKDPYGPCFPGGHFGICGPPPQAMFDPEVCVDVWGPIAARSCDGVPGQKYHQRLYRCPCFGLPPEARLMSRSMLLPKVKLRLVVCPAT